jgi:putative ABC transport system permease protein
VHKTNIMKQIFDNFIFTMRRFGTTSWINIIGLSVAFAIAMVVVLQVRYDFSYNRGFKDSKDIYEMILIAETWATAPNLQIPEELNDRIPEIDDYVAVKYIGRNRWDVKDANDKTSVHAVETYQVTPGLYNVVSPEIIAGDTTGVLTTTGKCLISAKTAAIMFGNDNPVGKMLLHDGVNEITVGAVYKDFDDNSLIKNGILLNMPEYSSHSFGFNVWLKIKPENYAAVEEKLQPGTPIYDMVNKNAVSDKDSDRLRVNLTPITDLYLYNDFDTHRINSTLALLAMGILVLAIALVNFLNFSVAMAPSRMRSAGIKKIFGMDTGKLRMIMASDGIFMALIAIALGLFYIHLFKSSPMAEFFEVDLTLSRHIPLIIAMSIFVLMLIYSIGWLSARYVTSGDTASAVKGTYATTPKGKRLRSVLIVIQFATAMVMISMSAAVKMQHEYMKNYSLGFDKEHVAFVSLYDLVVSAEEGKAQDKINAFIEELMRKPYFSDYTLSSAIPGTGYQEYWGVTIKDVYVQPGVMRVSPNFFKFFNIPITMGEGFAADTPLDKIVVNEAFLQASELGDSIVGWPILSDWQIIGVSEDVHLQPVNRTVSPIMFIPTLNFNDHSTVLLLKVHGSNAHEAMTYIGDTWKKFSDSTLNNSGFLDEVINDTYKRENNMSKFIGMTGLMVVLIAVMGIYGLILFNTRYKRKEIALRKVNGATRGEIVLMLNRNMLWLLAIAFVIAVPVAVIIIRSWLADYPYKVHIPWWLYLLSGVLVLLISAVTVAWQSWRAASENPAIAMKTE